MWLVVFCCLFTYLSQAFQNSSSCAEVSYFFLACSSAFQVDYWCSGNLLLEVYNPSVCWWSRSGKHRLIWLYFAVIGYFYMDLYIFFVRMFFSFIFTVSHSSMKTLMCIGSLWTWIMSEAILFNGIVVGYDKATLVCVITA